MAEAILGHKDFYNFSELVKRKDVIVVSSLSLGPACFFTHPAIQDFNSGIDTSNFGILDIVNIK